MIEGIGSEVSLAVILYLTVKDVVVPLVKNVTGKKIGKKNGNGIGKVQYKYNPHPPGETEICRQNRDKIIALETNQRAIKDDISEIKSDIKDLKKK